MKHMQVQGARGAHVLQAQAGLHDGQRGAAALLQRRRHERAVVDARAEGDARAPRVGCLVILILDRLLVRREDARALQAARARRWRALSWSMGAPSMRTPDERSWR